MNLLFHKYQGTGNDFIVGDNRSGIWDSLNVDQRTKLCHRRFGIGADGLLLLAEPSKSSHALFQMQYFNADGKPGSFCGNGSRCLLAFAAELLGITTNSWIQFEAFDGLHEGKINSDGSISVRMRKNSVPAIHQEGYVLDTGSPHLVIQSEDAVKIDVVARGRALRYAPEFEPGGLNVNFFHIQKDGSLFVRTYERGVEDETFSCGTGVTAVAVVYGMIYKPMAEKIDLHTPGGKLSVILSDQNTAEGPVLNGPAVCVYSGTITI